MEKNLTNVPFSTIYFYWIFQQKFGKSHLRLKSTQNHILYSLCRNGVSKVNSNPQFLMGLFHPPPSSRLHEWTSWIQILNHFWIFARFDKVKECSPRFTLFLCRIGHGFYYCSAIVTHGIPNIFVIVKETNEHEKTS